MTASNTIRCLALMLLALQIVSTEDEFEVPNVTIQAFNPKGFRVFIEDIPKLTTFVFQGRKNKPITEIDIGEISGEVTASTKGRWIYEDPDLKLKVGDVINYYVFVVYDRKGYLSGRLSYKITELTSRGSLPSIGPTECLPTATVLRFGTACAGQIIFEDNFESLREDLWQLEQYIPDQPEYHFVSYQRPPNAETVTVENGYLRIEPKLQQEQRGFTNESLYCGSLNLFNGCTRTTEACSVTATGTNILPPIVSGRLSSKHFAFTYGTVEIRAKLPQGDWIYPDILLESLLKKYGANNYASGVIRIAGARGNRELTLGPNEFGNKILYGGPIMNLKCKNILTGSRQLFNSSYWGDDFHTYTMQWTPERITLMVDGEEWLRTEPTDGSLQGRFNRFCDIPRNFLSQGSAMAPFDDHFQLVLGVAAGGVTEFRDKVVTGDGNLKPWSNRKKKASYNFWRAMSTWHPTWRNPALIIDYVKVRAL